MNDTPGKLFALLCVLGAVWTGVYWLWEPRGPRTTVDPRKPDPGITIDPRATGGAPPPLPGNVPGGKSTDPATGKTKPDSAGPGSPRQSPPPAPSPKPEASRRGPRVVPPEFDEYTVKRGDTFDSIAKARYGNANLRGAILRANPLTSDDLLRPGMTILLPKDPSNIQGRVVAPAPEPSREPAEAPAKPTEASKPGVAGGSGGGRTYRIQSDDTLWGISKKFYGKGAMYRLIADANKDKIPNPDDTLPVGVEIVIPEAPR